MNGTLVSIVVGFLLGYLSFEITEWRRRRIRYEATRRGLLAELEVVEVILGQLVIVLSVGTDHAVRAAQELRRLSTEDLEDVLLIGQLPAGGSRLLERPEEELAQILQQQWPPMKNPIGTKVEIPVVNGALTSSEFYSSREQLQALIAVRWHTSLLAHQAEWMNHWLRMTFEVGDPENHELVVANHAQALMAYRQRVEVMLGAVRKALERLRDP
jgi:hypothetical protein